MQAPQATGRRVMLIHPPSGLYRRDDRCQSKVSDQTVQVVFPPLNLAYLAACLERAGAECFVRDYPPQRATLADFERDLHALRPTELVVGVTFPTLANDLEACAIAKAAVPGLRVIGRGELFQVLDRPLLAEHPALDVVLRGEAEETIVELVSGRPPAEILGISYRPDPWSGKPEDVVRTQDRPFLRELDQLPLPARHLLDNSLYRTPESGRMLTTIETQRGCPAKCIYCPAPIANGYRIRTRSPQSIVDELRDCIDRHGIRDFLFHADTFTWMKKWVLELCAVIEREGFAIRWGCNSRVDTIDDERLAAMKRAGCWVIGFGVETGNAETLDKIKKNAKLSDAENAFRLCRKHGIRSHCFLVIGFPWETREMIEETIEFARSLDPDFFDVNIAYPLPGTEFDQLVRDEGLLDFDRTANGGYGIPAVRTHALDAEELDRLRRQALLRLYFRPAYIARTLWQAGSPAVMARYIGAGVRRAGSLLRSSLADRSAAKMRSQPATTSNR